MLLSWRRPRNDKIGHGMRISYLSAVCKRYDAISNAVSQEMRWLSALAGNKTHLFTYACNQPGVRYTRTRNPGDVVMHPFFQRSELIVCHFGIFFELFDAILAAPVSAQVLIVFHNITPKEFVPTSQHALIDRSFAQLANLQHADKVICVSDTNLEVLRKAGITTKACTLPLAIPGIWSPPSGKPSQHDGVIRLLFIGRFVQSKGLADLLQALTILLEKQNLPPLELSLVGNLAMSERALIAEIERLAGQLQSRHPEQLNIHIHFSVSDAVKRQLLDAADLFVLPSYHEGFCVPIVEAISSGCRVVCYDNSNLPSICQGLAELVPTGNIAALAASIQKTILQTQAGPDSRQKYENYRRSASAYAEGFSEARAKSAFLSHVQSLCNRPLDPAV